MLPFLAKSVIDLDNVDAGLAKCLAGTAIPACRRLQPPLVGTPHTITSLCTGALSLQAAMIERFRIVCALLQSA